MQPASTGRWIKWVPNGLSLLRLVIAVTFPMLPQSARWRGPLILVAGLSDFGDGLIARRFGAASWPGGLLDAIADKGFVLSVLITIAVEGYLQPWQVLLLLCRDIVVATIAGFASIIRQWSTFRRMPARLSGKLTTGLIFVFLLVVMIGSDHIRVTQVFFALAALFSTLAAADYAVQFLRAYRIYRQQGPM